MLFKNNKGFSLIELVVVMAIVGVLMMVGVPTVQDYIAKAKRTEMRTNLAQIYAAEKSFNAEYATYLSGLDLIGYRPEGAMNYIYGFSAAGSARIPSGLPNQGGVPAVLNTIAVCDVIANKTTSTRDCFRTQSAQDASVPTAGGPYRSEQATFTAFAAGAISNAANMDDVWSVNQKKVFAHLQDNITNADGGDAGN